MRDVQSAAFARYGSTNFVVEQLARPESADDQYLNSRVRILELTQRAHEPYLEQDAANRRRLLGFLLAVCTLQSGRLTPNYRQSFDILARSSAMVAAVGPTSRLGFKIAS